MAYVGIDLGTTNSCVAVINDDKVVEIIKYKNGSRTIPSSVTFTDDGTLVGFESINASRKYLTNTVYEAKRMIGQTYDKIKDHIEPNSYPFQTVEQRGYPKIIIDRNNKDVLVSPEEVSAEVLKKLKDMAEEHLDCTVRQAVITVPAYFVSSQREATKTAARMAGFETVNLINEPTAAALAYCRNLPEDKETKILVYDFGGGTFDVSVVSIKNKHCKVLGIDGDVHLGGADIDMNLVHFLKHDVKRKRRLELGGSAMMKKLRRMAKSIKEELSTVDEFEVTMNDVCDGYTCRMTRHFFEELNEDVFHRTLVIVAKCLKDVGLEPRDIDDIILVGGSSRIPKVRTLLESFFTTSRLNHTVNPDEAVAHGAAIYASFIANNRMETTFQDVVSLSLGIETLGDIMSTLIKRNAEIPCMGLKEYTTTEHNQSNIIVKVYQGERPIASKNNFLGNFVITNLTPARRGVAKIRVLFSLNNEGLLTVTATEIGTHNEKNLQIDMDRHIVQTQDLNDQLDESARTRDEEQQHVKFVQRRNRFKMFCDDLKESLEGTNQESKNFVIAKLDEAVRNTADIEKISRLEIQLKIQGNNVDDLKAYFAFAHNLI